MDYIIRLATREDLSRLPEIERAAAKLFPDEDVPPHMVDYNTPFEDFEEAHAAGMLWVAALNGSPVGFAHLLPMDDHIHLEELDVHPDHGKRGLGRRLVSAVIEWAAREGYPAITLTTFRHLPWNAPFYQSLGFAALEESALSDSLRAELDYEEQQGLDRTKRLAMRKKLP